MLLGRGVLSLSSRSSSFWNRRMNLSNLSVRQPLARTYSTQLSNIIRPTDPSDQQQQPVLQIQSVCTKYFKLSNSLIVPSSFVILNDSQNHSQIFLWNTPPDLSSLSLDHFKLFQVLESRPELLVLGIGSSLSAINQSNLSEVKTYLNSLGIQVDVLDTRSACSNYNLLLEEGRSISGAFMTLEPVNLPLVDQ